MRGVAERVVWRVYMLDLFGVVGWYRSLTRESFQGTVRDPDVL